MGRLLIIAWVILLPWLGAPWPGAPVAAYGFINDAEIAYFQDKVHEMPVGEKIAFWARRFVGTPYDTDPTGEYVTKEAIVADERVDCMYLTFRAVELALSGSPGEAVGIALEKRFITKGVLKDVRVVNYDERFQYAEDMLKSGRWGRDVTASLGQTIAIGGSRGIESVNIIPKEQMGAAIKNMQSGDIVYFVKRPEKRVVGEIVGHIGIISRPNGDTSDTSDTADTSVYLVHASGRKGALPTNLPATGSPAVGEVKAVLLSDYISAMPFAGIIVGRF